jgi:hypothetical protein
MRRRYLRPAERDGKRTDSSGAEIDPLERRLLTAEIVRGFAFDLVPERHLRWSGHRNHRRLERPRARSRGSAVIGGGERRVVVQGSRTRTRISAVTPRAALGR